MKSLLLITICCMFILACHYAEAYPRHKAGIGLSTISGAGLSYQMEISKGWAIQFTAFPYYFGTNPPDDLDIYLVAGAELQFNFINDKSSRFFSFIGLSHWYVEQRSVNEYRHNDILKVDRIKNINMLTNVGAGIGYEYIIKNSVAISTNLGLHYQSSKKSHLGILIDRNPHGLNYFGIGGGIGVHFLF